MNQDDLKKFEGLCESFFGPNQQKRVAADSALGVFNNKSAIPQLQAVLRVSKSTHGLMFASMCLHKLVKNNWNAFNLKQKVELHVLGKRGQNLAKYSVRFLVDVVGVITKYGWHEEQSNRELPVQIRKYFIDHKNPALSAVGVSILRGIVVEINRVDKHFSLREHRKVACSFRDLALRSIFEIGLYCLKEIRDHAQQLGMYQNLLVEALSLLETCLKFDFIGIYPDEPTDEILVINVPDSWRPLFEENNTVETLWEFLVSVPHREAKVTLMKILGLLGCLRRALFSDDEERRKYINSFMGGMVKFLLGGSQAGLGIEEVFHNFCRLLSKIKGNFLMNDFVAGPNYPKWIDTVAKFSLATFQRFHMGNSLFYILQLWRNLLKGRMSAAFVSKKKGVVGEDFLSRYAPSIASKFIISRMELAKRLAMGGAQTGMDNPLEGPDRVQILEIVPWLFHSDYKVVQKTMIGVFNNVFGEYRKQCCSSGMQMPQTLGRVRELEGQLAWLVYMFGSVLGHDTFSAQDKMHAEEIDGHLTVRVFQMFDVINQRLQASANSAFDPFLQRVELGVLYFLKRFQEAYLMDRVRDNDKVVFRVMRNSLNVGGHTEVLNIFMDKVSKNLKFWGKSNEIVKETLSLFEGMSASYRLKAVVAGLKMTRFMLENHGPNQLPFLKEPCNQKVRRTFYQVLTRSLFLRNTTEIDFQKFMAPVEKMASQLGTLKNVSELRSHAGAVCGLFRDLRGICSACRTKPQYNYFFRWFYPRHFALLSRALASFAQDHRAVHPLLKLLLEIVTNKSRRIEFGYSSPNGILLFKETSKIIVGYGKHLQSLNVNQKSENIYSLKYRGISLLLRILDKSLLGRYCNFGVFELYNDRCLIDCLGISLKLVLDVPSQDRLQYPKLRDAFFSLIENLFKNFIEVICQFDTPVFRQLLDGIGWGLLLPQLQLSSKSCSALDNLCSYVFDNRLKKNKVMQRLAGHLSKIKEYFQRILTKLFRSIIYEDCGNQWSVSRVMLSLICLDPSYFENLKGNIINSLQDAERKKKMQGEFVKLMKGVEFNLEPGNKDTFTANLVSFRANCRKFV